MKKYIAAVALAIVTITAQAQDSTKPIVSAPTLLPTAVTADINAGRKNIIKMNLSSLSVNNYSFQYERALSKRFSVALGFRQMPKGNLPLQDAVEDIIDDPSLKVNEFKMGNYAITPEVRWYVSKRGWMRGFYVAAYGRYSNFSLDVPVSYNSTVLVPPAGPITVSKTAVFGGNITAFSGGLMLGMQYTFGRVVLDVWLVGAHIGAGNGNLNFAVNPPPMSPQEQAELKKNLDNIDIPFVSTTSTVNANGGTIAASGSWGGVRAAGLNLGIRF
ncbi:MAG: DUF3575 domain-containing protein [Bacteroidetes bacterium]|nr:MAG: DUF3575 domain-containing protein [Bacteroidota bacterium]